MGGIELTSVFVAYLQNGTYLAINRGREFFYYIHK